MTPICALDTETTGLHPQRQAWDIAMIRRDDNGESGWQFYVEVDLADADPFALKVGRFYDRHPYGRYLAKDLPHPFSWPVTNRRLGELLSPSEAARHVARVTHGAHIIGAVPNFDTEVLATLLRRHGLTPGWHYHLIDVEALALGWLHGRAQAGAHNAGLPMEILTRLPWKSDDLAAACGVESPDEEERHTALGDAKWALRLYDAITGPGG
jgi:hypothetical protein